MRITVQPPVRHDNGYALIMIMVFLAVTLTVFASMMYWTSSNAKITMRNNAFTGAEAAAESGVETMLAPMIRDFDNCGALNSTNTYVSVTTDQTGWPISYQISGSVAIDRTQETNLVALSSQFAGLMLMGYVDYCTNTATATAINGPVAVPATVQLCTEFASIPIFQYAIFYNMDLEICPGAAMTIGGHVHSNNNIYYTGNSASQPLTFASMVDSSGFSTNSRSPSDPQTWSPGNVNFNVPGQPLQNVDSLSMPIGTNNSPAAVAAIIQLPPSSITIPSAAAYSPTGQVYLYNQADLIITNDTTGTNLTVLYNNGNATTQLTPVQPDVLIIATNYQTKTQTIAPTTNAVYYSFVTNVSFYDYREKDTVRAIQIDVGKLNAWLTNNATIISNIVKGATSGTNMYIGGTNRGGYQYNQMNINGSTSKGRNIWSIYVYNSVPLTSTTLPAVRLVNGSQLPSSTLFGNTFFSGLTVATAQPIYTLGNYNVTNNGATAFTLGSTTNGGTVPAALIGDSLTILSQNWSDSYSLANTAVSSTTLNGRTAIQTTVNAAALEGIVPSVTVNGTKQYSGGVENFLRLLENWNGVNLNYNGSIVVMFPSQYATNFWIGPGTYYNAPNRNWGFDLNFTKGQSYQPPMSPQVNYVIRSAYSAW